MKVSGLFIMLVLLSCFWHQIAALSDCMVTCPVGCQQQKNCDAASATCVCRCDCSPSYNTPPSTTDPTKPPPSTTDPTQPPPSTTDPTQPGQPSLDEKIRRCIITGESALPCVGDYLAALLDPNLPFISYCCQNLKNLQENCVNGFLPPGVAPVNIFLIEINHHCQGN